MCTRIRILSHTGVSWFVDAPTDCTPCHVLLVCFFDEMSDAERYNKRFCRGLGAFSLGTEEGIQMQQRGTTILRVSLC